LTNVKNQITVSQSTQSARFEMESQVSGDTPTEYQKRSRGVTLLALLLVFVVGMASLFGHAAAHVDGAHGDHTSSSLVEPHDHDGEDHGDCGVCSVAVEYSPLLAVPVHVEAKTGFPHFSNRHTLPPQRPPRA
jgi:hypothetical protein